MEKIDNIIYQGHFNKGILEILKSEVEKCKDKVDMFNKFYTTKKFLKDG